MNIRNREAHKNFRLSSKAIKDFKKIYKEEFDEDLSDAEAEDRALCLLRFFQILLNPTAPKPQEETWKENKSRKSMTHCVAPIGYLNNLSKDKGERNIIPDPDRFYLVRKMWDLMLTGANTPPQILKIVNKDWGFQTRKLKRLGGTSEVLPATHFCITIFFPYRTNPRDLIFSSLSYS